ETLARRSGLIARPMRLPQPPDSLLAGGDEAIGDWLDNAAGYLGLEAEPVSVQYSGFAEFIRAGGPAIVRLPPAAPEEPPAYLGLLNGGRNHAVLLCPDLRTRRMRLETLQSAVWLPYEGYL